MFRIVEFTSEEATVRGRLYLDSQIQKPVPVVIMAHGFSATINGMVADRYAEAFYNAGFGVLLYDHRNFGISDGEPRQQINKWLQARGYIDAINFVMSLPEIDHSKIILWGDSMSAAEIIAVGAVDERVKGLIAQVPAFGDELPPEDPEGKLFGQIKETLLNGKLEVHPDDVIGPMPVVSFDPKTYPSLLQPITAFRWFIEYGGRFNTKWENNATLAIPKVPVQLNPVLCMPYINAALLMVVAKNDEMEGANSDVAMTAYERAPDPKKLVLMDGGHFGIIHYPSEEFNEASKEQVDFLQKHFR